MKTLHRLKLSIINTFSLIYFSKIFNKYSKIMNIIYLLLSTEILDIRSLEQRGWECFMFAYVSNDPTSVK